MEEGNPDHWRIVVESKETPAVTRQIRVQGPINLNDPSGIMEPRAAPPSLPHVPPDWVTAAVLDDNIEVARRTPKSCSPHIEISSPDDLYDDDDISDYYEGQEEDKAGHFDAEDLYRQHETKEFSSDADSIYDDTDTPETPDRWSDEEEVEEEYPHVPRR